MALYDRDYTRTADTAYTEVSTTASVTFVKRTYQFLAASMISAAIGAYIALPYAQSVAQYRWPLFGFVMFMLWFGFGMVRNKPVLNLASLFVFTFAMGVMLVPMFAMLIGAGKGAVIGNAFLMTSVLFGSLSLFAVNSKTDFSSWGKPLFIVMMVVFVAMLVNIFILHSGIMSVIISAGFLIIFGIYTIYDTQNIINGAYSSPVDAAISLFVDFFNMFTSLLQLLGIFGGDD